MSRLLPALQTVLADRGWGQYPLPRRSPRREGPVLTAFQRALLVAFCAFWILVLGTALVAMLYVAGVFAWALLTT